MNKSPTGYVDTTPPEFWTHWRAWSLAIERRQKTAATERAAKTKTQGETMR